MDMWKSCADCQHFAGFLLLLQSEITLIQWCLWNHGLREDFVCANQQPLT